MNLARRRTSVLLALISISTMLATVESRPALGAGIWPNDPKFPNQANSAELMRLPEAWEIRTQGAPIAVLDTGVNLTHPDLQAQIVAGYDFVDNDADPSDPWEGGSGVAGLAAATGDNGIGVAGATWDADIIPVRVRSSHYDPGDPLVVADGIEWAVDSGASVITVSVALEEDSAPLREAVDHAVANDVLVVASAGESQDGSPRYPAAYPDVLGVGVTNHTGDAIPGEVRGDWLDLTAPAWGVWSTRSVDDYYQSFWGPSYAAGRVAGIASLARAEYPDESAQETIGRLTSSALDAGPPGYDEFYGHGLVDAYAALTNAPRRRSSGELYDAEHEPNDTAMRASPIDLGVMTKGDISPEGDVDWYAVTARSPGWLKVEIQPVLCCQRDGISSGPEVSLFGRDLQPLDRDVDGQYHSTVRPVARVVSAGMYYVRVRNVRPGQSGTPYKFVVKLSRSTPPPSMGPRADGPYIDPTPHEDAGEPTNSEFCDVTGDGFDEIVVLVTDFMTPVEPHEGLYVYTHRRGAFEELAHLEMTSHSFLCGDMDRDGKDDVVHGSFGVSILYSKGGGTFNDVSLTEKEGYPVHLMRVGATKRLSIVIERYYSPSYATALLHQSKLGTFVERKLSPEINWEYVDLDGDRRTDLVRMGDPIQVRHQRLDGTFAPTEELAWDTDHSYGSHAFGDLTGDGRPDIAFSPWNPGVGPLPPIVQRQVDGGFEAVPETAGLTSMETSAVFLNDLTGDGKLDLINYHGASMSIRAGTPKRAQLFSEERSFYDTHTRSRVLFDFGDGNRDGQKDILITDSRVEMFMFFSSVPERQWIVETSPATNARSVPIDKTIRVVAARDLRPATVNANTVLVVNQDEREQVPAEVTYDAETRTIGIATSLEPATAYLVRIGRVAAKNGVRLTDPYEFRFVTRS